MRPFPTCLALGIALGVIATPRGPSAQVTPAAGPNRTDDPANALPIGSVAPDFEITGSTRYGILASPIHLSDFKGKTVVLSFFPRARTRGCTIQMRAYRDAYSEMFRVGQDVVLLAISVDPPEEQWTWARDEQFQFLFGSDPESKLAQQYGAHAGACGAARFLYVIDPSGKVTYRATPFMETDGFACVGSA